MRPNFAFCFALVCATTFAAASDVSRRLFDFTPVSAANPIVATIDGAIEIPLSELRAYRDAERMRAISDPASLAQKRAVLDGLIDEYLYVDDADRSGVARSPGFTRQMEATRTMLLTDFMSARASGTASASVAETGDAATALAESLFAAALIEVSNEAYDVLKRAAQAIDAASAASKRSLEASRDASARLYAILDATPDGVIVRYQDKTISVRQILAIYAGISGARPNVQTQEGFTALIKPLILPELMALEAAKRGIEAEPDFQHKLTQNRNTLLRFHAHGVIEARANDVLKSPDLDRQLQAWYADHAETYAVAVKDSAAKKIPALVDVRGRALADFSVDLRDRLRAEKAHELRKTRTVVVDESVLGAL